jgi:hypothetical protein
METSEVSQVDNAWDIRVSWNRKVTITNGRVDRT